MKTQPQYIKNAHHCPRCNSREVESGSFEADDPAYASCATHCNNCQLNWTDLFTLTGYEVENS